MSSPSSSSSFFRRLQLLDLSEQAPAVGRFFPAGDSMLVIRFVFSSSGGGKRAQLPHPHELWPGGARIAGLLFGGRHYYVASSEEGSVRNVDAQTPPPRRLFLRRTLGVRGGEQTLQQACSQEYPGSARCVQSFDDSLDSAIRITYRISLRSSSMWEPRHPSLKVVLDFRLSAAQARVLLLFLSWGKRLFRAAPTQGEKGGHTLATLNARL